MLIDLLDRRSVLRLIMIGALGVAAAGCGGSSTKVVGGGSSPPPSRGGGGGGGGGGGSTTVSVRQATINNGANIANGGTWHNDLLVRGVSASNGSVNGDLNYGAWQAVGASFAQVSIGSPVSWNGVGSSTGSVNFTAK